MSTFSASRLRGELVHKQGAPWCVTCPCMAAGKEDPGLPLSRQDWVAGAGLEQWGVGGGGLACCGSTPGLSLSPLDPSGLEHFGPVPCQLVLRCSHGH